MAHESYFRIPTHRSYEEWMKENVLKKIAVMFDGAGSIVGKKGFATEKDSNDDMTIKAHVHLYQSNSGYKYQVGVGNDLKMDVKLESDNIYLLASRYDNPFTMQEISRGICHILHLDYVYNMEFEYKIREQIHPLLEKDLRDMGATDHRLQDQIYLRSRELIQGAMRLERIFEMELSDNRMQNIVIQLMLKQILK